MSTRRQFLKAAAALLLAPAFPGRKLWAHDVTDRACLGPCLRRAFEWTTLHRRLVPRFSSGQWSTVFDVGEIPVTRDDLLADAEHRLCFTPRNLLFWGHITDIHLIDEESPGRLVAAEPYLESIGVRTAFHPQEDLTLQVLDAMVRTFNGISERAPLDFLLSTGDGTDNAHEIELQWLLDVIEGTEVDPDSGTDQDPVPGPGNDANDSFVAAGLRSEIPFYTAVGNHDVLLQGQIPSHGRWIYNLVVRRYFELLYLHDPTGHTCNAVITPAAEPPIPGNLVSGTIIPDARRNPLDVRNFIRRHLTRDTSRLVLGFPPDLYDAEHGYYSFRPRAEIPIRFVVLDSVCRMGTGMGVIDRFQYENFLLPQLERAREDRELVVVASHHPADFIVDAAEFRNQALRDYNPSPAISQLIRERLPHVAPEQAWISGGALRETLMSCPNVFLHIAGHIHRNSITPVGERGRGYWEVVTSSLLGYPQHGRLLEIVYEGNGVGAIHTCVLDHASAPGTMADLSRQLACLDEGSADSIQFRTGNPADRNAILRFHIPSEVEID